MLFPQQAQQQQQQLADPWSGMAAQPQEHAILQGIEMLLDRREEKTEGTLQAVVRAEMVGVTKQIEKVERLQQETKEMQQKHKDSLMT